MGPLMVEYACPDCGQNRLAADSIVGERRKSPHCGESTTVPIDASPPTPRPPRPVPPPYGIDVVLADEPVAFVVRYVEPISQLLNTLSDGEKLRLSITATAGAEVSNNRQVGYDSCSFTVFSIDGENAFECTLASTPANVTALEATGFPWSPAARDLAGMVGASAQPIVEVRDAVAAAHRIRLAEMSAWLGRKMAASEVCPPPTVPSSLPAVGPPSPPPDKPWWRFWG